jgi:hypothetical protein
VSVNDGPVASIVPKVESEVALRMATTSKTKDKNLNDSEKARRGP